MGKPGLAAAALTAVAIGVPVASVIALPTAASAAPLLGSQPMRVVQHPPKAAPARQTVNQELASYVKRLEGVRYLYGGTSPKGFDCSGLTQYVYKHFGRHIPRTANGQFIAFKAVSRADARPGDLVFFHVSSNPGSYVYHVGVYEGGSHMVVASTGAGHVIWESFTWAGDTVTFGTITH
ncbi:MAG TPA: C40 family peptidase [Trebonia sp.]|nr:C40 family peptidase [Trebonia sp.]